MPPLESSLLQTTLFFELLGHRLTILELARITGISVSETRYGLLILVRKGILIERNGIYILSRFIESKSVENDEALPIAWRRMPFIRWLGRCNPFVKAVAVGNSLAMGNFGKGSDIDLMIVTKKNRLYLARLLFVIPLILLRLRPNETKRAPLCVSFMIDESALLMSDFTSANDIYFSHWCSSLVWVYDTSGIAEQCMKENRSLMIRQGLSSVAAMIQGFDDTSIFTRFVAKCMRAFDFNWCEDAMRRFELWYLPRQITELSNLKTSSVVITPFVFKTHLKDRREEIAKKWYELCVMYGCI